jgi:DNA-directed RNA polymerase specialized sigma24 family protein
MTELNSVSASEHIQALYRLLLIRTGQRLQAEQVLRETLTESLQNNRSDRSKTDFVEYYRTALKKPTPASGPLQTDLAGWPLALHHLPEPQRSAITLFYLEIFSPRVLSELLGLDMVELANLISAARSSLDSQQTNSTIV